MKIDVKKGVFARMRSNTFKMKNKPNFTPILLLLQVKRGSRYFVYLLVFSSFLSGFPAVNSLILRLFPAFSKLKFASGTYGSTPPLFLFSRNVFYFFCEKVTKSQVGWWFLWERNKLANEDFVPQSSFAIHYLVYSWWKLSIEDAGKSSICWGFLMKLLNKS